MTRYQLTHLREQTGSVLCGDGEAHRRRGAGRCAAAVSLDDFEEEMRTFLISGELLHAPEQLFVPVRSPALLSLKPLAPSPACVGLLFLGVHVGSLERPSVDPRISSRAGSRWSTCVRRSLAMGLSLVQAALRREPPCSLSHRGHLGRSWTGDLLYAFITSCL